MSSRLLTPPHAFPFPFYLKYVNSACNDTDTDTATAESSGVSNNASLSFERAGLLMGPHNSYVRAEAAFQLAMWQNERMPRVLSTAVAGGSTCTLTLFHLHVPLPFTPALLLPSLHLSLCCGLENRFINSIFRQIALRIEAASFRSSRLIFSFLISSHLFFPHLISSYLPSSHLISLCHNLRSVPCSHSAALCAVGSVLASGYRPPPAQRLL